MIVNFNEKQMSAIQIALGMQSMEWGKNIEDAEYNGAYDHVEKYENLQLLGIEISNKLYSGDKDFSKEQIEMLIDLYKSFISDDAKRIDVSKEEKESLINEDSKILDLLIAAIN